MTEPEADRVILAVCGCLTLAIAGWIGLTAWILLR
jgi:hypothetical protein